MRGVSSSIVVLAGAVCFSVGGHIGHVDTQQFVMLVGGGLALFGLIVWISWLRETRENRP